ncbi:MAG: CcmD family protein [Acidobacteria bacterium]|nr:CcmD family protein [Acidobacteriota bacterium]
MSGETLLVLAYAVVWVVLTGYIVLLARRQTRIEAEIRALRAAHEPAPAPPPPSATPPSAS